ncbi:MAG: hypothetical protein AABZ57_08090 [Candidatus Margulisiibacteriota bacterium]
MGSLVEALNIKRGRLLPPVVKQRFVHDLRQGEMSMGISRMRDILLDWTLQSMPEIADHHGIPLSQVRDTIQHYRFGFVQAEKIWAAVPWLPPITKEDKRFIALFTCVHDIGRMMTGSGASEDRYAADMEGNLLHPIAGAQMLKEVYFHSDFKARNGEQTTFLQALDAVTERHTLSVGIPNANMEKGHVREIIGYESRQSLMLYDSMVEMCFRNPFSLYTHLVAMADAANNVSEALTGTLDYQATDGLGAVITNSGYESGPIIRYIMEGPGNGEFHVTTTDNRELDVTRLWKGGTTLNRDYFHPVLDGLKNKATHFFEGDQRALVADYFWKGVSNLYVS